MRLKANYFTIGESSFQEFEIKKSRFLTYIYPIEREDQVNELLKQLKKDHHKANHHCWAYILGHHYEIQRMSDDGEPSGTAGVPMLEVLKKQDLTNILVVVVRYFGGIKLGGGGLIRAYAGCVSDSLKQMTIMQNISQQIVHLGISYGQVDSFQYYLQHTEDHITILSQDYGAQVTYKLAILVEEADQVKTTITNRFKGQIEWTEQGIETVNVPVTPVKQDQNS